MMNKPNYFLGGNVCYRKQKNFTKKIQIYILRILKDDGFITQEEVTNRREQTENKSKYFENRHDIAKLKTY